MDDLILLHHRPWLKSNDKRKIDELGKKAVGKGLLNKAKEGDFAVGGCLNFNKMEKRLQNDTTWQHSKEMEMLNFILSELGYLQGHNRIQQNHQEAAKYFFVCRTRKLSCSKLSRSIKSQKYFHLLSKRR